MSHVRIHIPLSRLSRYQIKHLLKQIVPDRFFLDKRRSMPGHEWLTACVYLTDDYKRDMTLLKTFMDAKPVMLWVYDDPDRSQFDAMAAAPNAKAKRSLKAQIEYRIASMKPGYFSRYPTFGHTLTNVRERAIQRTMDEMGLSEADYIKWYFESGYQPPSTLEV